MIAIGLWLIGAFAVLWLISFSLAVIVGVIYGLCRIVYFGFGPSLCIFAVYATFEGTRWIIGWDGTPRDAGVGTLWLVAAITSVIVGVIATKFAFGLWDKSNRAATPTEPFIIFRFPDSWQRPNVRQEPATRSDNREM
jgi:hypothetical protein